MIGVVCKPGERDAAREFFELFKTPWEFYIPGAAYEVVVVTSGECPDTAAGLVVVYGSETASTDRGHGPSTHTLRRGGTLRYGDRTIPVYGPVRSFSGRGHAWVATETGAAGLRNMHDGQMVVTLGYDLFDEVRVLLSRGQPVEHAHIPTLDLHVALLRDAIVEAGISLVEIPPAPPGHRFVVALTHDIDFLGIRRHRLDHTMWGFVYRSTVGAAGRFARGRLALRRLLATWRAVASLPFVYLGWARDFWEPFGWYAHVEADVPATYFLIPFKNRPGDRVDGPHRHRRAAAYDLSELARDAEALARHGCEIAVHGIDAWHSAVAGREERAGVAGLAAGRVSGVRMHWLLRDAGTFHALEDAGYDYDATSGYNETIGYLNGTAQAYRPLGVEALLALPLHVQDGAMFLPNRLDLSEADAWERCARIVDETQEHGGVVTILWHDRSHAAERFWGEFYVALVERLRSLRPWFATCAQTAAWFGKRRRARFERVGGASDTLRLAATEAEESLPGLTVRVHAPSRLASTSPAWVDFAWDGARSLRLDDLVSAARLTPSRSESATTGMHESAPRLACPLGAPSR